MLAGRHGMRHGDAMVDGGEEEDENVASQPTI